MGSDNEKSNVQALEEPVRPSRWYSITTVLIAALFAFVFYILSDKGESVWFFAILMAMVVIPIIWLLPVRVGFYNGEFYIRRLLRTKVVPIDQISEVRVFTPSPADGRICAVNGLLGRYGWFKSWEIGLYFSYVANSDEAFLICTKPDGRGKERKYVISCKNNVRMVSTLSNLISRN